MAYSAMVDRNAVPIAEKPSLRGMSRTIEASNGAQFSSTMARIASRG